MSDNWLCLVPVDPRTRPSVAAATVAIAVLKSAFPQAGDVTARHEQTVVFHDAGTNTESISCPACGADAQPWWSDAMSAAYETDFTDLAITTPCCATRTSLNDLVYVGPAAFGRFSLNILNPGLPTLADPTRAQIERLLGTRLTVVWRHL